MINHVVRRVVSKRSARLARRCELWLQACGAFCFRHVSGIKSREISTRIDVNNVVPAAQWQPTAHAHTNAAFLPFSLPFFLPFFLRHFESLILHQIALSASRWRSWLSHSLTVQQQLLTTHPFTIMQCRFVFKKSANKLVQNDTLVRISVKRYFMHVPSVLISDSAFLWYCL